MPLTQATGTVVERRAAGAALELVIHSPALARLLSPGQPLLVKAGPTLSPYLRRTFYPIALGAEDFTIRIPPSSDWGDAWLRVAPPGAELDCLGPIGAGFSLDSGIRNLLCVGEGALAWGLLPLIDWADAAGLSVTFVAGSVEHARCTPSSPPACRRRVSPRNQRRAGRDRPPAHVDVVGPAAVGRRTLRRADRGAPTPPWPPRYGRHATRSRPASPKPIYPSQFLCGTGACLACVADVAGGRRRVCLRGPVFDLVDIVGRAGD